MMVLVSHLHLPNESYDIVYCISVLEHTAEYETQFSENSAGFSTRVESLILTFDVCIEGSADISMEGARDLVRAVGKHFHFAEGFDAEEQIRKMPEQSQILTPRYAAKIDKALLPIETPWLTGLTTAVGGLLRRDMRPLLKLVAMLNHLTCFCMVAEKA